MAAATARTTRHDRGVFIEADADEIAEAVHALTKRDDPERWLAFTTKHSATLVTMGVTAALVALVDENRALAQQVALVDAKLQALASEPRLKFLGAWDPAVTYEPGNTVQHKGAVWCALTTTRRAPGDERAQGHRDWQLMTRAGRDGRNGKDTDLATIERLVQQAVAQARP